jgi:hypothetical protein
MPNIREYPEINADLLKDQGLLDIIQTPVDGIDRHPDIPWRRVSNLALRVMYISSPEKLTPYPSYQLIVHFKKEKPRQHGFVLKQEKDETFAISTVAGADAGLVSLDVETSATIARLLMESLQS